MPDVRLLNMPPAERQILEVVGIDKTGYGLVSPGSDDTQVWECEDGRHIPVEQSTILLTLHYVSALGEDACFFLRIGVPGVPESIYIFDAGMSSASQVVVGVAGREEQDAIDLLARLADQDESRIPNKIISDLGADIGKARLLNGWNKVGIYKRHPSDFPGDYAACDFSVNAKRRRKRPDRGRN